MHTEDQCIHEGTCYPVNHVSAAFDTQLAAEKASEALRIAGFTDIGLFHGQEAYDAIQEKSRQQNVLVRTWRRMRDVGREGELHHQYLATLQQGGSYLIVYTTMTEQVNRAHEILVAHAGYNIWHAGPWAMERLPER
jgi:hypothetical protein